MARSLKDHIGFSLLFSTGTARPAQGKKGRPPIRGTAFVPMPYSRFSRLERMRSVTMW